MKITKLEIDGPDLTEAMNARGLTRRRFIQRLAKAGVGAASFAALPGFPAVGASRKDSRRARKKVVILATEVRYLSHAQHFIDRFLEGYGWAGEHHYPPFELASMYIDQFPQRDLSRERSARHGVPIYPTIAEALTLGGSKLAVDGVLIIAEHGRYPRNEKGQTLYPRYRFFKEVMKVFESSGRTVPVFNDKHLSTDWKESVEMVEDARRLGFAFLAGSSLPVTWRIPSIEMPLGTPLVASLCACYGGVDSYDFHGYETAQCMSERRAGGESGVIAVQALRGAGVWDKLAAHEESRRLLFAALARSHTVKPPPGYTLPVWSMDWFREACPNPFGCFIEHRNGFQTTMLLLTGLIQDFNYAGLTRPGEIISTQMYLPMPPRNTTLPNFFNPLVNSIERTILERRAVYPLERTLLTSGMTLFGVESLHRGQSRIETPEMAIAYRAPRESTYWRS